MMHDVVVPSAGESVTEGVLAGWSKDDGELVEQGEPLCDLETDKVTLQVTAPESGRLQVVVAAGATVQVGQVIARIDDSAGASASAPPPAAAPAPPLVAPAGMPQALEKLAAAGPVAVPSPTPASAAPSAPVAATAARELSPAVRRIVTEQSIEPTEVVPTGPRGHITKGDVLRHLGIRADAPPAPAGREPAPTAVGVSAALPGPPGAPSPPAGARAASVAAAADRATRLASGTGAPAAGATRATGELVRETRTKMTVIRQRIAERMVLAQQQAAILTTFNEADMSRVIALREEHRASFEKRHGVRLGFMSFFVKAVVDALGTVPALNARIDGDELVQNHFFDIGVAVSTERGLLVPVVRNCDELGFGAIEQAIADLATRARQRTITLEELTGGGFSISNGGVYGSLLSTPILNPPQSGILGLHSIKKRPVVVDDQIVVRPMMYLALSYDHRIVDGQQAVTFLKRVVECIENPERMMLET